MLQKKFVLTYPIAVFCEISRSIGTGDLTVLQDNQKQIHEADVTFTQLVFHWLRAVATWHKRQRNENKVGVPYLSGRIGSSSRFSLPWIPWHSSAGISVSWWRQSCSLYPQTNDGLMQQHSIIMLPLIFLGHGHKRRKKTKTSEAQTITSSCVCPASKNSLASF